jgi:hypothetical protein
METIRTSDAMDGGDWGWLTGRKLNEAEMDVGNDDDFDLK